MQIHTRNLESRSRAEEKAGQNRDNAREEQHAGIHLDGACRRQAYWIENAKALHRGRSYSDT